MTSPNGNALRESRRPHTLVAPGSNLKGAGGKSAKRGANGAVEDEADQGAPPRRAMGRAHRGVWGRSHLCGGGSPLPSETGNETKEAGRGPPTS